MIITTLEELRMYFPTHALDSIEPMTGFLDNSEHDFLMEKLGYSLYGKLCCYYQDIGPSSLIEAIQTNTPLPYYARLLLLCQRCIVFDAFSRAIGVQVVSINNAGVNVSVAEDYAKADKETVETYRQTCIKEAHAAVNRLLATLEQWTKEVASTEKTDTPEEREPSCKEEITDLWRQSRYYFLAAGLLIPSAQVLQEYLNIYDSREKFIQMLPDLRFVQEEIIAPAIGEELCDYFVDLSLRGTCDKFLCRVIHKLRKVHATYLEERTAVLKTAQARRQAAHDEGDKLIKAVVEYLSLHQSDLPEDVVSLSPFYVPQADACRCPQQRFRNNSAGSAMFVTPALD